MGDGPSESQAGDDPATFDDEGVGYGNVNTTTAQALANDPSIDPGFAEVQSSRSASTPSFTQQSQNYVDDFSGANRGSLPTSRGTSTASLPISQTNMMRGTSGNQAFGGSDFNFAGSQAAQGLRDKQNLTGGFFPVIDAIAGFPSRMTINNLNKGQVPTYTDGQITGTTGQGFGANQTDGYIGGLANNQPGIIGGLNTNTSVDYGLDETIDNGGNNNDQEIIRRRLLGEVIPEEATPEISDDLAVNYLQDPYYLYSGINNQYQPYGYAQNTLVDLLRTRNMTQPQQRAANLGLFGNPGDFS